MFSWLFDKDAVNNIKTLWGDVRSKKLSKFNHQNKVEFLVYNPCMGIEWETSPLLLKILKFSDDSSDRKDFYNHIFLRNMRDYLESKEFLSKVSNELDAIAICAEPSSRQIDHIEGAISLLKEISPELYSVFTSLISMIVPIKYVKYSDRGSAFSCFDCFGSIFFNVEFFQETDRIEVMLAIVHECAHHVLMLYQHCDPIIESTKDVPIYSPVRKTDRPAIQSFHAMFSLTYMIEVITLALGSLSKSFNASLLSVKLSDYLENQVKTYDELLEKCDFTSFGEILLKQIGLQIKRSKDIIQC